MPAWLKSIIDFVVRVLSGGSTPTTTTARPTTTRPPTTTTARPTTTRPPTTTTAPPVDQVIKSLLDAHNSYRAHKGKSPLTLDQRLLEAAQAHAAWMARTGNFSHTGDGGSSVGGRIRAAGYNYSGAGENIAFGYTTVEAVMRGWIGSAGHEANIGGNFTNVGFGVVAGPGGRLYWVADFGRPAGGMLFDDESEVATSGPLTAPGLGDGTDLTPHRSENPGWSTNQAEARPTATNNVAEDGISGSCVVHSDGQRS